jgi:capsular exopolysaccharide synthesis family protein
MTLPVDHYPISDTAEAGLSRGDTTPAALSAPPSVETLWHAVRRRWRLIVVLGLIAGAAGAAGACFAVPGVYNVQTILYLGGRTNTGSGEPADADGTNYQRTQAALITSAPVLRAALERPEVAALAEVRAQADALEWLRKNLKTDLLLGPEVLKVTLAGDNGDDTALVLNEITRAYLKAVAAKDEAKVHERMRTLQENFKKYSEALRDKRQRLMARLESLGLDDPETIKIKIGNALQALTALQARKVELQLARQAAQSELAGLEARVKDPRKIVISDFAFAEEMKLDRVVAKAFDHLAELDEKEQRLRRVAANGSGESALTAVRSERAVVEQSIAQHAARMRPGIEAKLRSKILEESRENILKQQRALALFNEQEKALDEEIRKKEHQVATLRNANRPLEKGAADVETLRDEVAQIETVLRKVGDELAVLQAELPVTPRVSVLEAAKSPLSKTRDRQLKYAAGTCVGLFGFVLLAVALLEFRVRRVYSSDDVSRGLGLNLLGTLPELPEAARRVVSNGGNAHEQAALMEAVDGIRTRLLHAARGEGLKVIMVASAIGGEGKTSLASHLTASLARGRRKTLLVDCDLRNPAAHLQFDMPLTPGFAEGLRGEAAFEDLVRPTPLPNLSLVTAGMCDRQAVEALAQEDLGAIFDRLKEGYDFVVVDVCPVLPVTDALLVGQHADAVLFAVLRNVSRLPAVHEAQQRLTALDIRTLGAVVVGEVVRTYGVERYVAGVKGPVGASL